MLQLRRYLDRRYRRETSHMSDVLFIGIALAFFALMVAYVRGLDHFVRASEKAEAESTHEVIA